MLKRVAHWLFYFLVFAFLGWIWETIVVSITNGVFTPRGVFFVSNFGSFSLPWGLPMISLYGFGGLILFALYRQKDKISKNPIVIFCVVTVVLTLLELLFSYISEIFFGKRYWFYEDVFTFQGRISVLASLAWGALGTLCLAFLCPRLEKIFQKYVTKKWHFYLIVTLTIYLFVCLALRDQLFPFVYYELV